MKAGILAIGTELLMGKTVNTNATYLSQKLNEIGIGVYYHLTIGDNPQRIIDMFQLLLETCDVIVTTGGLGPTLDDITKEIIAKTLDLEMVFDEHSMSRVEARFKQFNRVMTENNRRQAFFPEGAIILDNDMGTAPACILKQIHGNKHIIILPGPPKEMKWIYKTYIDSYLKELSSQKTVSKYLSVYDLGESSTEHELMDMIHNQIDPSIATYAGDGKVLLRVTSFGESEETCFEKVNETVAEIYKRIGTYIVSDQGKDLDEVVKDLLVEKEITISFAESCTGGKFVETIVKHSGASLVVDRGLVTYSNQSKIDELGVNPETLERFGAVSEQTCQEMVEGLCRKTGTQIGIAVTGVAGPTGGTESKPVGLVYIGICVNGLTKLYENQFTGDRQSIQIRVVNKALKLLYDELLKI